jgi:hypothetical protein
MPLIVLLKSAHAAERAFTRDVRPGRRAHASQTTSRGRGEYAADHC